MMMSSVDMCIAWKGFEYNGFSGFLQGEPGNSRVWIGYGNSGFGDNRPLPPSY